ncbi:HTTM domain-containing protein [Algivirga pacifica]|uniref:HTTM domain-containing protein n=2 Tax=Algivirga pacifica TaxID=1162670 RepID=A0ABP9D9M0_9BACT
MMVFSTLRFAYYGWIEAFYVSPAVHFPFYGFEWVTPFSATGMYILFGIMGFSALMIALGAFYRISTTLFFLSFTYIELIDKTYYLNHYYFVSLVGFIMIFLPAHRYYSIDVIRKPSLLLKEIPYWTIFIIQFQLAVVYFFAGLTKLNKDWLLNAMPLKIWLKAFLEVPIVGKFMGTTTAAYLFSWAGAFYDLTVPFFLWYRKSRWLAYIAVIGFHIMTWMMFPIGVFPWVMIGSTLIFFSPDFHQKILRGLQKILNVHITDRPRSESFKTSSLLKGGVALYIAVQLLVPLRFMLYPGYHLWTEQGFRFAWKVMFIEKVGYVTFHVKDPETGRHGEVYARDFLTPLQEKMMATQPDMILQFAHYIEEHYKAKGIKDPIVMAEAYVTLNGRASQLMIDPNRDLTKEEDSFAHKDWILPFKE